MAEKLTPDRLEELLLTKEPAEIRQTYAGQLDDQCLRFLAMFEGLDNDLQALKALDPAPPVVTAEKPRVMPFVQPAQRPRSRTMMLRMMPIAAVVVAGLLLFVLVPPDGDVLKQLSAETPTESRSDDALEPETPTRESILEEDPADALFNEALMIEEEVATETPAPAAASLATPENRASSEPVPTPAKKKMKARKDNIGVEGDVGRQAETAPMEPAPAPREPALAKQSRTRTAEAKQPAPQAKADADTQPPRPKQAQAERAETEIAVNQPSSAGATLTEELGLSTKKKETSPTGTAWESTVEAEATKDRGKQQYSTNQHLFNQLPLVNSQPINTWLELFATWSRKPPRNLFTNKASIQWPVTTLENRRPALTLRWLGEKAGEDTYILHWQGEGSKSDQTGKLLCRLDQKGRCMAIQPMP